MYTLLKCIWVVIAAVIKNSNNKVEWQRSTNKRKKYAIQKLLLLCLTSPLYFPTRAYFLPAIVIQVSVQSKRFCGHVVDCKGNSSAFLSKSHKFAILTAKKPLTKGSLMQERINFKENNSRKVVLSENRYVMIEGFITQKKKSKCPDLVL